LSKSLPSSVLGGGRGKIEGEYGQEKNSITKVWSENRPKLGLGLGGLGEEKKVRFEQVTRNQSSRQEN